MMRHAGIHWPENADGEHPNRQTIADMPGMAGAALICSPSARYHYDYLRQRRPTAIVVWRAIPRQGKLPADFDWIGKRVADECLNLWDEQPHGGIEYFQPLNELQFEKEAGEPFRSYAETASKLSNVRIALRQRFQELGHTVRLIFPPWVPMDDGDTLAQWEDEAQQWDVIGLHCYGAAETMLARYQAYRDAFPGKPIFVGEWNSNHEGHDERASLEMWAEVAAADPLFLGATYYIWETLNAGERDLSIWGDGARYGLFLDPPGSALPPSDEEPKEEPTMPELPFGIDVSNNNGHIDWPRVAAGGVSFAIAKVSEGTWFRDAYFAENWQAMKRHGIVRGAYHFARPSAAAAVDEARYFVEAIGLLGQTLEPGDLLALDLEDDQAGGDLSDWTLAWLQEVERLAGYKPLVYTSPAYAQEHQLARRPEIGEYGLWLASWGVPTPPAAPAPWDLVAVHQYGVGGVGSVPGVAGECDLNRYNGPLETLRLYGKPGAAEPPASNFSVGQGILDRMAALGDSPASDEEYVARGWSEAVGTSGRVYRWVRFTGTVLVFDPAA